MGILWGKFRKKASTYEELEKLDTQINTIEQYGVTTELKQRKVAGRFMLVSVFLYLVTALVFYFYLFPVDIYHRILYIVPLIASPVIIIFIKRVLTWWYNRKLRRNQEKLSSLRKKKKEILDNVMEKETYKVAKKILETFAPDEVIGRKSLNGNFETPKRDSFKIQPTPYPVGLRQRVLMQSVDRIPQSGNSAISDKSKFPENQMLPRTPGTSMTVMNRTLSNDNLRFGSNLVASTPKLPMVRSLLPRDRSAFDKLVDFLIGDGPSNRYALICQKCHSHNGMALREEFEYVSFNCCYCHHFNHARKQKPPAPKLGAANINTSRSLKERDTSDSEKNSSSSDSDTQTIQKSEDDLLKETSAPDVIASEPEIVNEAVTSTLEEMDTSDIPESS